MVHTDPETGKPVFGETDYRFYLATILIIGNIIIWIIMGLVYGMDALVTIVSITISLISTVLSFYFVQVSYERNQERARSMEAYYNEMRSEIKALVSEMNK